MFMASASAGGDTDALFSLTEPPESFGVTDASGPFDSADPSDVNIIPSTSSVANVPPPTSLVANGPPPSFSSLTSTFSVSNAKRSRSSSTNGPRQNIPVNIRFQALVLAEYGVPLQHIQSHLNVSLKTLYRLRKIARNRGFDPAVSPIVKLEYVEDAPRSGRPAKVTSEIEDAIVESFVGDRGGSNKPVRTVKVAEDLGVSATTVLRVLDKRKVAFDRKSGHSHWDGTWKVMPDKKSTAKAKAKTKQDTGASNSITETPSEEGMPTGEQI